MLGIEDWLKILGSVVVLVAAGIAVLRLLIRDQIANGIRTEFSAVRRDQDAEIRGLGERLLALEHRPVGVAETTCVERMGVSQKSTAAAVRIAILEAASPAKGSTTPPRIPADGGD